MLIDDVKTRLDFYSHVLPAWLEEIRVYYDPDNEDGVLYVKQYFSRRFIKFYVCGGYANVPFDERDEVILHEIAHIFIGPMADIMETYKEVLITDPVIEKLMDDQTEKIEEFMVVDLIALLKAAGLEPEDEDAEE
jgi:hypothetical protein